MNTALKITLSIIPMGLLALAGYYVVDRVFVKKAPLFPFSLKKAQEKKANDALSLTKNKLNRLIEENKIHEFGIVYDADTKKNYIEVATLGITPALRNDIPDKVNGIEVRLVQRPITIKQQL